MTLTLELPANIEGPLLEAARRRGATLESLFVDWATQEAARLENEKASVSNFDESRFEALLVNDELSALDYLAETTPVAQLSDNPVCDMYGEYHDEKGAV